MMGKLVVITGYSGAGKDTLLNMLLKKRPHFERVVTHTSFKFLYQVLMAGLKMNVSKNILLLFMQM